MKDTKVNGRSYRLDELDIFEKSEIGMEVVSAIGPVVNKFMTGMNIDVNELKKGSDMSEDAQTSLLAVFMSALPTLDMKKINEVFKTVIGNVSCQEGKLSDPFIRETWFQKNSGDFYAVALWATWNSCSDFLVGALPGIQEVFLGATAAAESQSPKDGN